MDFQFSPDGRRVGPDPSPPLLRQFHYAPGREYRTLPGVRSGERSSGYQANLPAAAHRTGRWLALSTSDHGVGLVDLLRLEEMSVLPVSETVPVCFHCTGNGLVTSGRHGLLRWPVRAVGTALHVGPPETLHGWAKVSDCAASADGSVVAIPSLASKALIWRRGQNQPLEVGPQDEVWHCAVSPDGRWVATGSHGLYQGSGARIWDARTGKHVADLPVGEFCPVSFSPDGRWLLTGHRDFRLWSVGDWQEGPALGRAATGAGSAFTADGRLLALSDSLAVVRLVEPATGRELARLTAPEQTRLVPKCFTPDGSMLVAVGAETRALHVFDLRAIRLQLAELGLDWDRPPYPPAPEVGPLTPVTVRWAPPN